MMMNQMAVEYRESCIRELRNDLLDEIDKVISSNTISRESRDWALNMVMSILLQVQK